MNPRPPGLEANVLATVPPRSVHVDKSSYSKKQAKCRAIRHVTLRILITLFRSSIKYNKIHVWNNSYSIQIWYVFCSPSRVLVSMRSTWTREENSCDKIGQTTTPLILFLLVFSWHTMQYDLNSSTLSLKMLANFLSSSFIIRSRPPWPVAMWAALIMSYVSSIVTKNRWFFWCFPLLYQLVSVATLKNLIPEWIK